ncbi:MAG: PadR family transcriptional regulator [Solirubrobacteraceae bacterium]|nr:PadR family transcriptional regulator [Patulibacter sp.]
MAVRLTPTSFIVLGLVRWSPGASAYELEGTIRATVSHMWSIQRSQVYREPIRLAEAGLLEATDTPERRGTGYAITPAGEQALDDWLAASADEMPQMRDLSILKLFFGATPATLARTRILQHQARLKEYEVLQAAGAMAPIGARRALQAALLHERASIKFWSDLAKDEGDAAD